MVSPYPPSIPRIIPGEQITQTQVQYLEAGLRIGLFAMDPSDMSLRILRVVAYAAAPSGPGGNTWHQKRSVRGGGEWTAWPHSPHGKERRGPDGIHARVHH